MVAKFVTNNVTSVYGLNTLGPLFLWQCLALNLCKLQVLNIWMHTQEDLGDPCTCAKRKFSFYARILSSKPYLVHSAVKFIENSHQIVKFSQNYKSSPS